jgi:hypothetical protein
MNRQDDGCVQTKVPDNYMKSAMSRQLAADDSDHYSWHRNSDDEISKQKIYK